MSNSDEYNIPGLDPENGENKGNENNNGNGVVDSGETIRVYVSLHNGGGVATDVKVSIDTLRNGEFTDPYFTLVNTEISLSDIGTYSVRKSGDKYFEIIVSSDCPNDYLADFNIHFTYSSLKGFQVLPVMF